MNKVITFRGLYDAYCDCRKRKRRTANAQRYEICLLDNLYDTLAALHDRSYSPHRAIRFVAQKPKAREIHAADLELKVLAQPQPVSAGTDFLGYIVRPHYRLVRRRVVGNLREKLQMFQRQIVHGNVHSGYTLVLQPDILNQLKVVSNVAWLTV